MHVAVIVGSLFGDTRSFLRLLAAQPGVDVTLLKADTDPTRALRILRDAHRLWFEGTGPLLADLADRPAADWLAGAYLRISAADADRLPAPGLWRLVRTVFVPDPATAERVRALDPSPASAGTRVEPAGETPDRVEWLGAKAGDLRTKDWTIVLRLVEQCRGRVRLVGNPPPELADMVTRACGLKVVEEEPADTRLFWRAGPGLMSEFRVETVPGGAGDPVPPNPPPPDPSADDVPLVSAVVPVYNGEETIDRCLRSLRRQTWPNLEIVVIDDGSTDGTAERTAKHLNDPRVRFVDTPHAGRPGSRNRGIAEARGRWIAWLDADDEAMPNRIRTEVEAAQAAGDADVVHADGLLVGPDGAVTFTRRSRSYPAEDLPARLLAGVADICPILNTSALVRRDLYDRLGGYDAAFPRCQDFEFWCRCAAAGEVRFVHVPVPLVKVDRPPHAQQTRTEALGARLRVARRLVEAAGGEALIDPLARDLRETLDVVLGRTLLATGIGMEAPGDHPIFAEAEACLRRGRDDACAETRRESAFLLDELSAYRRQGTAERPAGGFGGRPAVAPVGIESCADPT